MQLIRPKDGGAFKEHYDSSDRDALSRETAWPIVDDYVLQESVRNIFEWGEQNDVPLLTGSTADEGATLPYAHTLREFETGAREQFGPAAEDFFKLYRAGNDAEAETAARQAAGAKSNWENWMWACLQDRTGHSKVFAYHFGRAPPRPLLGTSGDLSRDLGAFHTAEIPYVFDHLGIRDWPWQEADHRLAQAMSSYWVNFAERGDPNGSGLAPWPCFDEAAQQVMHFSEKISAGAVPNSERLAFWSAFEDKVRQNPRQ
jgi:para-nitrobenzyl esterase